jgi:hypothetical protein
MSAHDATTFDTFYAERVHGKVSKDMDDACLALGAILPVYLRELPVVELLERSTGDGLSIAWAPLRVYFHINRRRSTDAIYYIVARFRRQHRGIRRQETEFAHVAHATLLKHLERTYLFYDMVEVPRVLVPYDGETYVVLAKRHPVTRAIAFLLLDAKTRECRIRPLALYPPEADKPLATNEIILKAKDELYSAVVDALVAAGVVETVPVHTRYGDDRPVYRLRPLEAPDSWDNYY